MRDCGEVPCSSVAQGGFEDFVILLGGDESKTGLRYATAEGDLNSDSGDRRGLVMMQDSGEFHCA
jgi:hypothetical protein